jgi:hypothetical protein
MGADQMERQLRTLLIAVGGDFVRNLFRRHMGRFPQFNAARWTSTAAFAAVDVQHIESADQITEYDRAVAGHSLFRCPASHSFFEVM